MAPVTGSLILLILCCAGALADNYGKRPPREKPGKCPPTPLAPCLPKSPPGDCNVDKDCRGEQKCCRHLCSTKCKAPIKEKPGTCPPPMTMCSAKVQPGKCKVDSECPGKQKCCIKYCSPECIKVN